MTKKICQATSTKNKSKPVTKILSSHELKSLALRKVKEQKNKQKNSFGISKLNQQKTHIPKKETKVRRQFFKQIVDQSVFECPVCIELMIEPTLLQCGHAYCFKCLQELMIYKSCCGVCRNIQTAPQFQKSTYLQTLIEKIILQKSKNYLEYYCRLADTQNWKKVRNILSHELTKGLLIDFRDKELKWRKAQIIKLNYDENFNIQEITVRYKKQSLETEETVDIDSGRYAKFSYYTRMKYLEQKPNCLSFENQMSEEILNIPFTDQFINMNDGMQSYFFHSLNQHEETVAGEETTFFDQVRQPEREPLSDHFLDEILENQHDQAIQLIEMLA